jgi:hypothetical protein
MRSLPLLYCNQHCVLNRNSQVGLDFPVSSFEKRISRRFSRITRIRKCFISYPGSPRKSAASSCPVAENADGLAHLPPSGTDLTGPVIVGECRDRLTPVVFRAVPQGSSMKHRHQRKSAVRLSIPLALNKIEWRRCRHLPAFPSVASVSTRSCANS